MSTVVYTDGACRGNPGPGGWAWAIDSGHWASGADAQTTNQRMEIMAAYQAVRDVAGPLEVRSDSTYVVKCFNDRWYRGWKARGWKNSQKQPVANRDLWEPFIDLVLARGDVTFTWVKGHSTDRMNQLVDRLAVEASRTQRGDRVGLADVAASEPVVVQVVEPVDVLEVEPVAVEVEPVEVEVVEAADQSATQGSLF